MTTPVIGILKLSIKSVAFFLVLIFFAILFMIWSEEGKSWRAQAEANRTFFEETK